jgi:hypothetical protein
MEFSSWQEFCAVDNICHGTSADYSYLGGGADASHFGSNIYGDAAASESIYSGESVTGDIIYGSTAKVSVNLNIEAPEFVPLRGTNSGAMGSDFKYNPIMTRRHVHKPFTMVDCESKDIFAITVGSKFVIMRQLCKELGDGACFSKANIGIGLYIGAYTDETLKIMKGFVLGQIASAKEKIARSSLQVWRTVSDVVTCSCEETECFGVRYKCVCKCHNFASVK